MFRKSICRWVSVFTIILSASLYGAEDTPRKILTKSIEIGDLAKVQSLIESFSVEIDQLSEDYDAQSPLLEAASKAKISIMKYLVEKGACIEGASNKGYSPLVKFIEAGKRVSFQQLIETVRWLINSGADVNGAGEDGYTPLMAACKSTRCLELVEMLLDMGAFIDARAKDDNTAYLLALRNSNLKSYHLLVNRGANTKMTWKGLSPLSMLAWEGNITMAKMLIEETGANVNGYETTEGTPLVYATIGCQSAMIQFLVEKGGNINVRTTGPISIEVSQSPYSFLKKYVIFPKGSTPLNFAKTMGYDAIYNLITDLGGILYHEVEYKEVSRW